MTAGAQPTCWIIAGPNGAGKTTFALDYLPNVAGCEVFVNADLIAAGMSPLAPQRERIAANRICSGSHAPAWEQVATLQRRVSSSRCRAESK